MSRGGYGVAVIASLLFVVVLSGGRLEAAPAAQATSLLPGTMARDEAAVTLAERLGAPVVLVDPDPRMLEDLRWATPDPSRAACADRVRQLIDEVADRKLVKETPTEARLFGALIKQAAAQILFVDLRGALQSLSEARDVLPCSPDIVTQEQVRALFLHEAVAHLYLKDGQDRQAFLNMLAVDPRVYLEEDYSPRIRNEYLEAAKAWSILPPVKHDRAELEGDYYVDGQPAKSLESLRPGQHVVQVKGPEGEVRTAMVSMATGLTSVRISALADFGLPGSSQVRSRLASALLERRLQPAQEKALEALIATRDPASMVFAVEGADGGPPVLRLYQSGKGVLEYDRALLAAGHGAVRAPAGSSRPGTDLPGEEGGLLSGVRIGVGLGVQVLPDMPRARYANQVALGPSVHAEIPVRPFAIEGRAALYSQAARTVTTDCGGASGVAPTEEDLDGAISCLPIHPAADVGIGVGFPVALTERLTLVPILYVDAAYHSEIVVLDDSGELEGAMVEDALMLGPLLQGRLTYGRVKAGRRLDVGLELSAGARFAITGDTRFLALPLGLSLVGGLTF